MAYKRKGGSGKSGSLKQQFNYYKKQLYNRLLEEQAFKEARGIGTIESEVFTLFTNLDYEAIFNEGITRKVGNQTVRFKGEQAIKLQIESLRKRSSKAIQADNFINNYILAMDHAEFSYWAQITVRSLLESISIDKLTYIYEEGILPEIAYLYNTGESEEDFVDSVEYACKHGVSTQSLKEFRTRKKELKKVLKEKNKILGR